MSGAAAAFDRRGPAHRRESASARGAGCWPGWSSGRARSRRRGRGPRQSGRAAGPLPMTVAHNGRMARVLLIAANREQFPEPAFPLGAAYVSGALEAHGHDVRLFDAGLARRPLAALRRAVADHAPDVIGLSLRNIDNAAYPCTRSYVSWYEELAGAARSAAPAARLIVGGSAFAIFPEELLELLGADVGVTGDGEAGMLAAIGNGHSGVLERRLDDLAAVGLPAGLERVFPSFRRYRTIGVQTARGCPVPLPLLHLPDPGGSTPAPPSARGGGRRARRAAGPASCGRVLHRRLGLQRRRGAPRRRLPRRDRPASGAALLLLPAARDERPLALRPARRGGLHGRRFRHRQRQRGDARASGQELHRRGAARRLGRLQTRRHRLLPLAPLRRTRARRARRWPRRCA